MSLVTISPADFKVDKLICQGTFGEVYQGTWNGKVVAIIKLQLKTLSKKLQEEFDTETKIMAECQKEHPEASQLSDIRQSPVFDAHAKIFETYGFKF